jgi:hypothetical protein
MQTGLVHLHSVLRWVILIMLVISIIKAFKGLRSCETFRDGDRKTWLFTMIAAHVTLLIGLYQWLMGRYGLISMHLPEGSAIPEGKFLRFYQIEHPIIMIISIVLITLGYGMAKKQVDAKVKYRKALTYFIYALVLILLGIPWPFREVVGRALFPGM